MRTDKTHVRLNGCPSRSESSLTEHKCFIINNMFGRLLGTLFDQDRTVEDTEKTSFQRACAWFALEGTGSMCLFHFRT